MAEQPIDKLVIDIQVRQNKSVATINSIVESIDNLKSSLSEIQEPLNKFASVVNKIGKVNTIAKNSNKTWTETTNVVNHLGESYTKMFTTTERLDGELTKNTKIYDENKNVLKETTLEVDKFGNKTKTLKNNVKDSSKSMVEFYGKLGLIAYGIKRSWEALGKFVKSSNAYIENLNLFNVTFGELNEKATEFVEVYSKTLALDPSSVMRNFGILNQIAEGFGLASDKAYDVAKTLTQLAYDASSYFNISIEESFLKFKSGLAGELEPLRAIGYALDEATLQQVAYNHGIQESIRVMTQADKAQLRTIAIYEQSENVMNDLAQTLDSPANAMRVLNQQWELFKRSIGNIIVPLMTKVLPTMQAFVEILTEAGNAIANFFGYKITGARTEDMINKIENLGDAYGNLNKEVKGSLLNIDKFSVLSKENEDKPLDLDIPTYDALLGAIDSKVNAIKENIKNLVPATFLTTLKELAELLFSVLKPIKELAYTISVSIFTVLKPIMDEVINPLIKGISKVAVAIIELLDKLHILKPLIIGLIGYFLIFHTTLKIKVVDAITSAIMGFGMLTTKIKLLSLSLGVAGAFGAFFALSALFDSFNADTRKTASAITLLTSTIVGLSMALLAMQGTLTMGVAVPIILTSVGAGLAGLKGLLSDVDEIKGYANGGFTNANLIKTNENGLHEWIGNQGKSSVIVNDRQMDDIMRSAVEQGTYNAISRANEYNSGQDLVLTLDGRELARGSVNHIVNALNSNYNVSIRPS